MDLQRTVSFVIDVVCGCAHGKTKNLKPLADHSYFFPMGEKTEWVYKMNSLM